MLFLKKLEDHSEVATIPDDSGISCRLFVKDKLSNRDFLIDTGADVSVIPPSFKTSKTSDCGIKIFAANGSSIRTFGQKIMHIDFGLRRNFSWTFIIADVTKPIIGSDFLKHFHLLPDLKRKALIDGKTDLQVSAKVSKYPSLGITTLVKDDSVYNKLLMKYPDVYQASTLPGIKTEHGIYHHIETSGPPVYAKSKSFSDCQKRF